MNIKEITALVTVASSRNFYEAAYTLNYSASVISKYISNIEKELGVVLFHRGTRANSVSLTKDGETLMPRFAQIYETYQGILDAVYALKGGFENSLRIGLCGYLSSSGRNEIMAEFIRQHPDVVVEQKRHNFKLLLQLLYLERLDGIFVMVQEGSANSNTLQSVLDDPKVESFLLTCERDMYLGISEKNPLAELEEAPLVAFRDFSIVFHTEQDILINAGTIAPFERISKKSGFALKPIFIDPREASTHFLATQAELAIPTLRSSFEYPGLKFVRVADWDTYSTSYFLVLKSNKSQTLSQFMNCVRGLSGTDKK